MRNRRVLNWLVLAIVGCLLIAGAWLFVHDPTYNLALIHPLVLLAFYLAVYGGGLAVLVGLTMTAWAIMKR